MKNTREMTCGMKNKKRNWSWLLPVALIIAVLISIIFTALIWVTPSHFQVFGSKSAPAAGSVDKNVAGKQSITDVYLPVSLTYYENDTRYQLSSTKIDVIDLARRRVKNVRIKKNFKSVFKFKKRRSMVDPIVNTTKTESLFEPYAAYAIDGVHPFSVSCGLKSLYFLI